MKNHINNHLAYQPSNKNSDFEFEHLSFADYITAMRHIISQSRLDLTVQNHEKILDANSPMEYVPQHEPATHGILLVHGLRDSPSAMTSLFDYYRKKGFIVRSLLLPGHGTIPGDLLNVSFKAWLKAFNYAVSCFRKEVKNLYIAGFSTGGSLALYQSYLSLDVQGIILIAPAIRIKSSFAAISQYHPLFSFLGKKGQWFIQLEENDYAKYQSIPYNAIAQLYRLTKIIASFKQQQIKTPLFMVLSDNDESIDCLAAKKFFNLQQNPLNRLLTYTTQEKLSEDARIHFSTSYHPHQKILDYSHIALTIAPDHSHYGKNGDYQDFVHYQLWWGKMFKNKRHLPLHYGSFNWHNISKYHLARLTYNPDFYSMMTRIDQFIESTQVR